MNADQHPCKDSKSDDSTVFNTNDPVKAQLRWYNPSRGYGFVLIEHDGSDAFLHATTLKRMQKDSIAEGTYLMCLIERGPKGHLVKEIVSVLDEDVPAQSSFSSVFELTGTVKWYDPDRGFGFVAADDGGKDIFLHSTCLIRHGLVTLERRTPLLMTVKSIPRGREVIEFSFLEKID